MGLFRKLGRNIEEFRQEAKNAAASTAGYECGACGASFHVERETCPDCGADAVEPAEPDDRDA